MKSSLTCFLDFPDVHRKGVPEAKPGVPVIRKGGSEAKPDGPASRKGGSEVKPDGPAIRKGGSEVKSDGPESPKNGPESWMNVSAEPQTDGCYSCWQNRYPWKRTRLDVLVETSSKRMKKTCSGCLYGSKNLNETEH